MKYFKIPGLPPEFNREHIAYYCDCDDDYSVEEWFSSGLELGAIQQIAPDRYRELC